MENGGMSLRPSTKLRIDCPEGMEYDDSQSSIVDSQMKIVCLDSRLGDHRAGE